MTQESVRPLQEFFEHLENGRLMLQRSRSSGTIVFYPRVAVPRTGETDLEWVPASGVGVVYATTVMRPRPPHEPYNVAVIELAEGPRMMSRVEGVAAQDVRIGMTVRARIISEDGKPMVVFSPEDSEETGQ